MLQILCWAHGPAYGEIHGPTVLTQQRIGVRRIDSLPGYSNPQNVNDLLQTQNVEKEASATNYQTSLMSKL